MWDLGLVDTDRVGNSYIYLHLTTCGTWDLLMQTELVIAIFTYIKQVWDVGHSWSKPQSVLYSTLMYTYKLVGHGTYWFRHYYVFL